MSDPITTAKRELAVDLATAGLTGVAFVPEDLPTPCVVIEGNDDYLGQDDDTFDGDAYWITAQLFALVDLVGNQQADEDLNALLCQVLPVVRDSTWELVGVGRPGPFHTTTWLAHGAAITVRNLITITQETP